MELTEDHIQIISDSYATAFVKDNLQFETAVLPPKVGTDKKLSKGTEGFSPTRAGRKTKQERNLEKSKDVSTFSKDEANLRSLTSPDYLEYLKRKEEYSKQDATRSPVALRKASKNVENTII